MSSIRPLFGAIVASAILACDNASAQSFPVGDVALRFEDSGSGPPVVLVPGWTQLTIATSNAAAVLGGTGEIGVVAPGALADLVVLDRDPLEDVANVRWVVAVFQGGRRVKLR